MGAPEAEIGLAPESVPAPLRRSPLADPFRRALRRALTDAPKALRHYYETRDYQPVWTYRRTAEPGDVYWPAVAAVFDEVARAPDHALPSARYPVAALKQRIDRFADLGSERRLRAAATLERDLSLLFTAYGKDLAGGALNPRRIDREMKWRRPRPSTQALLDQADSALSPGEVLAGLIRHDRYYQRLKAHYQKLRSALASADQQPILDGRKYCWVALRIKLQCIDHAFGGIRALIIRQLSRDIVEKCGKAFEIDPTVLSGGEARRAALARVLAPEPDVILL
ncbi:MAG: hypothetical protein AAFV62_11280, partial [Pseudomonadota bacterium]